MDRDCSAVSIHPDVLNTVICAPDDGWCHHPKHVEQYAAINKLYIVASRWTIINIDLRCMDFMDINFIDGRKYF